MKALIMTKIDLFYVHFQFINFHHVRKISRNPKFKIYDLCKNNIILYISEYEITLTMI